MAKVWVLDTETKGTGAQMLPLEKVLGQPGSDREPRRARPVPKPKRKLAQRGVFEGHAGTANSSTEA